MSPATAIQAFSGQPPHHRPADCLRRWPHPAHLRVAARHRWQPAPRSARDQLLFATAGAIIRNTFDQGTTLAASRHPGAWQREPSPSCYSSAAQLATNPNTLQSDGARRLLFFNLPLGFIAGLTFDAVYTKLRSVDAANIDALKPL